MPILQSLDIVADTTGSIVISRALAEVQESVRRLSRLLMFERGGVTTDDCTLLMLEWRGAPRDNLDTGGADGRPA